MAIFISVTAIFFRLVLDHGGVTHYAFHSDTFISKILEGYFWLFFNDFQDSGANISVTCISKTANKQRTFEMIVRNRFKIRFFKILIYTAAVVHPFLANSLI